MDTLNKILNLIKKRGLTDTKFSELTGLNKAVLFDWRSGKTKSYMKHLPKIAEVLGTNVEYLLEDEHYTENNSNLKSTKNTLLDKYDKLTDEQQKDVMQYIEFLINKNKSN